MRCRAACIGALGLTACGGAHGAMSSADAGGVALEGGSKGETADSGGVDGVDTGAVDAQPAADAVGTGGTYIGKVVAETLNQGQTEWYVSAGFSLPTEGSVLDGCSATPVASGSCCYLPLPVLNDAGDPIYVDGGAGVSAGTISLTDKSAQLGQLVFGAKGYATVQDPPTSSLSWMAGDTLQVMASGDVVGPFSDDVVVPAFPTLTPPPSPVGTAITLSLKETMATDASTASFSFTPTGVAGARVLLIMTSEEAGEIKCAANDQTGVVALPKTLVTSHFHANDVGQLVIGELITSHPSINSGIEIAAFSAFSWPVNYTQ